MMGGMNWAPAFETGYDNNNESSKKKRHKTIKKSVNIDLSQDESNDGSVSEED